MAAARLTPIGRTLEPRGGRLFSYGVLALALVATLAATYAFYRAADALDTSRFTDAVGSTEDRITGRIDTYLAILVATRGLFAAADDVTAAEFRAFVEQAELARRYPGVQGVGFTRRLDPEERPAVEAELRAQGLTDFRVWPQGEREELHAIVYLEPLDRRNRAALGYDMYTDPVRRAAMARARDTGAPAASGRVTLVQEIDEVKQAGFLIYVPVYEGGQIPPTVEERRERLLGFVYSPFRAGDLLSRLFAPTIEPRVAFRLYAGTGQDPETLLYGVPPAGRRPAFSAVRPLEVAGQRWTLAVHSVPSFERTMRRALWPYVLGSGLVVSGLLFLLSITQARANEQLQFQARILDSMREGVCVSNREGVILYTNPAEDRIFGYEPGELVGERVTIQNTYPPEENERIARDVVGQLRERGHWEGEFANVKKDGTTFVTAAHITALEVRGETYWVCVQEDVSDRKRAEEERSALIEREQALRAAAEAASRAKDEFLAMLGRELRNPLAPIVTALELVRLRSGDGLGREHEIIERQVRHLQGLVDDLLDVSRITRGKVELDRRPVELASAVASAVEMVSPLLETRRHELVAEVPEGLTVDADPARLAQIIANLLNNAAKYTDAGGRVEVSANRAGAMVELRVRDNGIGISAAQLSSIFDLFTQGDRSVDRSQGGLGIGLTLVRSLTELHGGRVTAASEGPGRGSEFTVTLPLWDEAGGAPLPAPRAATPRPAHARKILVVDDNVDAADLLADVLRGAGHEVEVAYDSHAAIQRASKDAPEIAVLDLGLPVMDGYELAAHLAAQRPRPTLIAVTGYGQQKDRERTTAAGFDHHFVKPVDIERLLAAIAKAPPPEDGREGEGPPGGS